MMKIYIAAGHRNNSNDFGASGKGVKESEVALLIALKLKKAVQKLGAVVYMSRETEHECISLQERTTKANDLGVDLYISIHCNAYNGQAKGIEVLYYSDSTLAKNMCNRMTSFTGAVNRGAKERKDLHVLKATKMDAVLAECGFIDNVYEGSLLVDEAYQNKLVKGMIDAIVNKYKLQVQTGTLIATMPTATIGQCKEWARSKQATGEFVDNAEIYFELCGDIGINPVMAYAQYALESGYGHHRGTVPPTYHNPCGLKVEEGGADTDKNAHKKFETWEDGISAHIDHIALYAGVEGYPKKDTLDPRHFGYLLGKYKTVEEIGKGWYLSNPEYGNTLLKFMKEMEQTEVEEKKAGKGVHGVRCIEIELNGKRKMVDVINKDGFNYVKLRNLVDDYIEVDYSKIPVVKVKG